MEDGKEGVDQHPPAAPVQPPPVTQPEPEQLQLLKNDMHDVQEQDEVAEEWIDRTNEPLGHIGNGYSLTPTLQTLCLTNNRLKRIDNLEPCVALSELILRQNSISEIEGLDTLTNLIELDLYMNSVSSISEPSLFTHNPRLQRLDLSFNEIRSLDGFPLANVPHLTELYLIGNKVRSIPAFTDSDGKLQVHDTLRMLELGDNRIRRMENLDAFPGLTSLWLGRNKIEHIEHISHMQSLEKLALQSNRIKQIDNLDALSNSLKELYVSHNGLSSMAGIEQLTNLTLLDVASNQIDRLHPCLARLTHLTELWINHNKLDTIEDLKLLAELPELQTVYLEGNPLAASEDYEQTALRILPDCLEQLDALLVEDVRKVIDEKDRKRRVEEERKDDDVVTVDATK